MTSSSGPSRGREAWFAFWSMAAAFATYFCMYAFRKPFAVGEYADLEVFGTPYKTVLVITQVAGYTMSKFLGIRVISEMPPHRRIAAILVLIGIAEVALVLFGLVPQPWNFVLLFFNGLPLGMVWGVVFSFLEGRRATEMLGAGLCCSFILASGAVKSVGKYLIEEQGVPEFWMPAATGAVFVVPLLIATWVLSRIPGPTDEDRDMRAPRPTMSRDDRRRFVREFALGIVLLVLIYSALNAYRDFRDNFAVELWAALGYADAPEVFTFSEVPIAVIVLIAAALMILIKDNRRAFTVSLMTILLGAAMVGLATLGYEAGMVDPAYWMVAVGLGMYVPYIAFHVMVFERLIAAARSPANVGFLMYVCDAFGYLGSVGVMLYRDFGQKELSWLDFFVGASYALTVGIAGLALVAVLWFRRHLPRARTP